MSRKKTVLKGPSTNAPLQAPKSSGPPVLVDRLFTQEGVTFDQVLDSVEWGRRDVRIDDKDGNAVFEQKQVEFPVFWTDTAVRIVTSKYFKGPMDSPSREDSLRSLLRRVVITIATWGAKDGYYTDRSAAAFAAELGYMLLHQTVSFNSPVWFNFGVHNTSGSYCWNDEIGQVRPVRPDEHKPQGSACFINKVEDNMESILQMYVKEGRIFKEGSGSGFNASPLRSSREFLSNGGRPSGPVSFLRGYDTNAANIKSGGKTRRAAKLVTLNVTHPDIEEFIACKVQEEQKAKALIAAGYSDQFDADATVGAYQTVNFQNTNHSIRTDGAFMNAADRNLDYHTLAVKGGHHIERKNARDVLRRAAEAAWACGDPGIQYDDNTNAWNVVLDIERINGSNPCGEYNFVDDSACNLASLNLMKFAIQGTLRFDSDSFRHACRMTILAQEIIVDNAGYPTPEIAKNSHDFRPLGLGYCNLGAYIMALGLPYDSEEGRKFAAAVTALMTGAAYAMSTDIAAVVGAFPRYGETTGSALRVLAQHRLEAVKLYDNVIGTKFDGIGLHALTEWDEAIDKASKHGFRNAQVSLLAPTGTIGFMMDAATTGVEPEIGLVKYKKCVGGGYLKLTNPIVSQALETLGYLLVEIQEIIFHIKETGTIEGAPHLKDEHLAVFDCAFKAAAGTRTIEPMGHIRMMAAVQPFLSGAISKTVNLPKDATPEDILQVYIEGWKMGLKAIAVYRDGCKDSQPLNLSKEDAKKETVTTPVAAVPVQRKMPKDRPALTHEFSLGGIKCFLTVGLYEDGTPGELFISISKEGSTLSGFVNAVAISTSFGLQYGVPLQKFVDKFKHMQFEPSGYSDNPEMGHAKSIIDYVFRWLENRFLKPSVEETVNDQPMKEPVKTSLSPVTSGDAPACTSCGNLMVRNASCYKCENCGSTSGCS